MKNNFDTSGLDARDILLDKPKYWAAHSIALLDGWKAYILQQGTRLRATR